MEHNSTLMNLDLNAATSVQRRRALDTMFPRDKLNFHNHKILTNAYRQLPDTLTLTLSPKHFSIEEDIFLMYQAYIKHYDVADVADALGKDHMITLKRYTFLRNNKIRTEEDRMMKLAMEKKEKEELETGHGGISDFHRIAEVVRLMTEEEFELSWTAFIGQETEKVRFIIRNICVVEKDMEGFTNHQR